MIPEKLTKLSLELARSNCRSSIRKSGIWWEYRRERSRPDESPAIDTGAHTFGQARCSTIQPRLSNWQGTGAPDPILASGYLNTLQGECGNGGLVDNDPSTGTTFDNNYYSNLLVNSGTFHSDQALLSDGGGTAASVNTFAGSQSQFFAQFVGGMLNMGRIPMPSGAFGEVRLNCRKAN